MTEQDPASARLLRNVTVPSHVYGLPDIGFGGYVAGILASELEGPVRVDFRSPVPLSSPLRIETKSGSVVLVDDRNSLLLAEASAAAPLAEPPEPAEWEGAVTASSVFVTSDFVTHPHCFGCGPARREGEGLRVFTGLTDVEVVAGAWTPHAAFADSDGCLALPFAWAALDCPGAWARRLLTPVTTGAVTASLSAEVRNQITAGQPHVVYAWVDSQEGRKTWVGSAVARPGGELCALARALWISVEDRG